MDQQHPHTPPVEPGTDPATGNRDDAPDRLGDVIPAGDVWLAYGRRPGPIAGNRTGQFVGEYGTEQDAVDALLLDALAPGGHLAHLERTRVPVGDDGTGCPITEEQLPNGASVPGTERVDHLKVCVDRPGGYAAQGHADAVDPARTAALAAIGRGARPGTAHFTGVPAGAVPWGSAGSEGGTTGGTSGGGSGSAGRRWTGPGYLETTGYTALGDDVKHVEPLPAFPSDCAPGGPPPPPGFRPADMADLVDYVAQELQAAAAEEHPLPTAHLLPQGSVVGDPPGTVSVYVKTGPESWEGTGSLQMSTDEDVDLLLAGGGKVLRVGLDGYPSGPRLATETAAAVAPIGSGLRPPDADVLREHHPLAGQPYRPERVTVGFDPSGLVFGWDSHAVRVEDWAAGFRVCKDCDPGVFKPGD